MNWQEFEDQIKKDALDHASPVDTEALWDRLRRKKRRRIAFWIWLAVGAVIGGGMGIWLTGTTADTRLQQSPVQEVLPSAAPPRAAATRTKTENLPTVTTMQPATSTTPQADVAPIVSSRPSHPIRIPDTATGRIQAEQTISNQYRIEETSKSSKIAQHQPGTEVAISEGKAAVTEAASGVNIAGGVSGQSQPFGDEGSGQKEVFSVVQQDNKNINLNNNILDIGFKNIEPQKAYINFLPILPYYSALFTHRNVPVWPETAVLAFESPKKKKARVPYLIGVEGYYGGWTIARETPDDSLFLRQYERPLAVFGAGIGGQIPLKKQWALHTGLAYTRFNSVFKWDTTFVQEQPRAIVNYYENGTTDTVFSGYTLVEKNRDVRHYNHLTTLTIPIELQRVISKKHLTLAPFVGIQGQFQFGSTGILLNSRLNDVSETDFSRVYSRRISMGVTAGCAVQIPLTRRIVLSFSPVLTADITPRTANEFRKERFYQANIRLGGYYRF